MFKLVNHATLKQQYSFFKYKHLLQITWSIQITIFLGIIQRIYIEQYTNAVIGFAMFLSLLGVVTLAKKRVKEASLILLFILMTMVTYFMWENAGINDEVVIAYPCILLVAAILGKKYLLPITLLFIIISLMLNAAVNHYDLYTNTVPELHLQGGILISLILILTSYTIFVMAEDFRGLLKRLESENEEVIQSKSEIELLLRHDPLTNLPNRLMAQEFFSNAVKKSKQEQTVLHVMFIDLDNFKLINDALGHQAGDLLLIEIAKRLKKSSRDCDLVSRLSGDEFIIIFDNLKDDETLEQIAERIILAIKEPFYYKDNEFICGASIGISEASEGDHDFDMLLRQADTAMYSSKVVGGNRFNYFEPEMDTKGYQYLSLITELRQALKEEQFFLVYQPQVCLIQNKIVGAEALIRWNHPEKGVIYPNQFIDEAEKSGLICEIGEWVLKEATKSCKRLLRENFDEFSIAVNVSPKQFSQCNISRVVESSLKEAELEGRHLDLEMTESLLIDNTQALKETFKHIQSLGVSFSVDDFGTGYSNLGYLQEFNIANLKIDQSFIFDLPNQSKNLILVKAMIQMAKGLDMCVIAEGIEDEATKQKLIEFECGYAQGYFWSKPLPYDEFIEYVHSFDKANKMEA